MTDDEINALCWPEMTYLEFAHVLIEAVLSRLPAASPKDSEGAIPDSLQTGQQNIHGNIHAASEAEGTPLFTVVVNRGSHCFGSYEKAYALPDGEYQLCIAPPAPVEAGGLKASKIERESDFSVRVVFPSCRLASEFERSLYAAPSDAPAQIDDEDTEAIERAGYSVPLNEQGDERAWAAELLGFKRGVHFDAPGLSLDDFSQYNKDSIALVLKGARADLSKPATVAQQRIGTVDVVDGRVRSYTFEQTDTRTGSYSLFTHPATVAQGDERDEGDMLTIAYMSGRYDERKYQEARAALSAQPAKGDGK